MAVGGAMNVDRICTVADNVNQKFCFPICPAGVNVYTPRSVGNCEFRYATTAGQNGMFESGDIFVKEVVQFWTCF